jgi:hypothetical protein
VLQIVGGGLRNSVSETLVIWHHLHGHAPTQSPQARCEAPSSHKNFDMPIARVHPLASWGDRINTLSVMLAGVIILVVGRVVALTTPLY